MIYHDVKNNWSYRYGVGRVYGTCTELDCPTLEDQFVGRNLPALRGRMAQHIKTAHTEGSLLEQLVNEYHSKHPLTDEPPF